MTLSTMGFPAHLAACYTSYKRDLLTGFKYGNIDGSSFGQLEFLYNPLKGFQSLQFNSSVCSLSILDLEIIDTAVFQYFTSIS